MTKLIGPIRNHACSQIRSDRLKVWILVEESRTIPMSPRNEAAMGRQLFVYHPLPLLLPSGLVLVHQIHYFVLVIMYSDLFDALGGRPQNAASATSNNSSNRAEPQPLLSFKAGKVEMALQDDGKYSCMPDTRRGQVNLKYGDDSQLVWEWYDRRENTVVDTIRITDPVTLKRAAVPPSQDKDTNDRVYYWKIDNEWRMIWLQDKEEDPELIPKANEILKQPTKPAETPEAEASASSSNNNSGPVSARSPGDASTSSASTTTRQVDALSNILENLGMPQGDGSGGSARAATAPALSGGTLTLADLQGAMSGLQNQQANTNPPGLHEIVTPDAISDLLGNEEVKNRLLQELPEEQRSLEHLEENLRSPQVQQTLRSLTSALIPDDNGSMDGYHSVLANFQLDAAAGQQTLTETNNPIQAFLDCVLASVEKEKKEEESKDEEMKED